MRKLPFTFLLLIFGGVGVANPAELRVPPMVTAGNTFSIATSGRGEADFYLVGPGHVARQKIRLGEEIRIAGTDVRISGRYLAILRSAEGNTSAAFFVSAETPASLSFLAHPSRVPVGESQGIGAVAFPLDKFRNLVLQPVDVRFELQAKDAPPVSLVVQTKSGVAWTPMDSSRKAGVAQLTAAVNGFRSTRVIQQVAATPCGLRVKAQRTARGLLVETDPVRDCLGNPVPDGTIVSFTIIGRKGKSTVDAPIKRGVASTQIPDPGAASISVASSVVIGNEIRVGEGQ
jgi:hypothetical protein